MKTVKLGDVCEFISRGISPKYTDSVSGIAVLNQRCIRNGEINIQFARLHDIHAKKVRDDKFVKVNDVLVNSTGQGTLGRSALVSTLDHPMLVDSHVTIVRPVSGIFEPRYFAYLISMCETDFIEMSTGASGQTELPRALLNEYKISYAESLTEQRRVVERLDGIFAQIDRASVLLEENIANTNVLKQSLLAQAFDANSATHTHRLGDVFTLQRGHDLPKHSREKGSFPLVSSSGVIDLIKVGKVRGPGVCTGRSGSIGSVFYINEDFWPLNTTLYIKDFKGNDPRYCYWLLNSIDLKSVAGGTGVPTLNRNVVHEIKVNIAEANEQPNIAKKLDKSKKEIDRLTHVYRLKIDKLTNLKQSLLAEAFSVQ